MSQALTLAAVVAVWCIGMAPGLFLVYDAWAWLLGLPQFYDWGASDKENGLRVWYVFLWCAATFFPCLFLFDVVDHSR